MGLSRGRASFILAATACCSVAVAACGSSGSTGPSNPEATVLAKAYDSLVTALLANGNASDSARATQVEIFNGIIANGAVPTSINLMVGGDSVVWQANSVNIVKSDLTDSLQALALWSGTSASAVQIAFFDKGVLLNAQVIAAGGDVLQDSVGALAVGSIVTDTGSCAFTSITNLNQSYLTYAPSEAACNPATAVFGGSVTYPHDATPTGAIGTIVVPPTIVTGVRLQDTTGNFFLRIQRGITTLNAASRVRTRLVRP